MGSEILVISVLGFAAIFSYLIINLKSEDEYLNIIFQVLGVGLIIVAALFLPKISIDEQNYCVTVAENATVTGSQTSYDYTRLCFDNTSGTPTLFYVFSLWVVRIIALFMFVYFIIYLLKKLREKNKGKGYG